MKIETLRIKNFKALHDVYMTDIPSFCVVVGANGSGKSTLFDVFGFLKDCLTFNVNRALQSRGGFHEVISREHQNDAIELEIQFRMQLTGKDRLVTYVLHIGCPDGKPIVEREILRYKRGSAGSPYHFMDFSQGIGYAVNNEEDFDKTDEQLDREPQTISPDTLGLKSMGNIKRFKAAFAFRELLEQWHVSDFHINLARGSKDAASPDQHLSVTGDNLQNVANRIKNDRPDIFSQIISRMRERVPGILHIDSEATQDGRLLLKFNDGAFKDPFIDKYVSDGTLKMFAYLVLLFDPEPHPLLCVEEPENQLYPSLLSLLAEEFSLYAYKGGQVFVSTHSPDFLNAVDLTSVFWLTKTDGYTQIHRASESALLTRMIAEGDKPGWLWKEGLFEGVNP